MAEIRSFGIRHHGPGSARAVLQALEAYQPDILLVEGPSDASDWIPWMIHHEMDPPVALLVYNPKSLTQAAYYPFCRFSPEWVGLRWALENGIECAFMDLPTGFRFHEKSAYFRSERPDSSKEAWELDPLGYLASLAGYPDGERWWEDQFENRSDYIDPFETIAELMGTLRENKLSPEDPTEQAREAYMRKCIREAVKNGFERIACINGAWHTPALDIKQFKKTADQLILKKGKATKVEATWISWTYERIAKFSGYGAGMIAPEWYRMIWDHEDRAVYFWMGQTARLLRSEGLVASTASVQEAVNLAQALAVLRQKRLPGVQELEDAALSIIAEGQQEWLSLIQLQAITGSRVGEVPAEIPQVPLQQDLESHPAIKRKNGLLHSSYGQVGLHQKAFDTRKDTHLQASILLYRLRLLGIPWGQPQIVEGNPKGSFHESWAIQWEVDYHFRIIEAGRFGNTVEIAARQYVFERLRQADTLSDLNRLLMEVLMADLPDCLDLIFTTIEDQLLIDTALLPQLQFFQNLVQVLKIGSTRKVDREGIRLMAENLLPRMILSLPGACVNLNDELAIDLFNELVKTSHDIHFLGVETLWKDWLLVVEQVEQDQFGHGLIRGWAARFLLNQEVWQEIQAGSAMHLALSGRSDHWDAAYWLEGFLHGSGLLLLFSNDLWQVLDNWVAEIPQEHFEEVLVVVRRAFAGFSAAEKVKILQKVLNKDFGMQLGPHQQASNKDRSQVVVPTIKTILGWN
ncbi:MAG: DUF5682 family protein [Bacteroidota bacterium]